MPFPRLSLSIDGPDCSRIALGFWRLADWKLDKAQTLQLIKSCLDLGVTTFDHANIYGEYECEQLFGDALAIDPGLRKRMQLVTKCGIRIVSPKVPNVQLAHYDFSKKHILTSLDSSLKKLRTDHVDLLLLHRPDFLMDADETADALITLKKAGKILHAGVSNFTPAQFDLLQSRLETEFRLVTNQIEFSVLHLQPLTDGTLDECQRLRIHPMAWSPFAGNRLFSEQTPQAVRVRAELEQIGRELGGATIDQVALAWLLEHPTRAQPVLGTGKIERIKQALGVVKLELTRQHWYRIWRASTGTDVP